MNDNVDRAELLKFADLASRWWDPLGPMRPLHDLNPVRLAWIDSLAPLAGQRVLDVGCGGGVLAEAMAMRGSKVIGIDLAGAALHVAQLHALESGAAIDYRESSAESYAEAMPEAFDIVTCMEMLEHVPDPAQVVAACARLARGGGQVFFSTINRTPRAFALAIVGAEYVLNLLPRGTHEFAKLIKPSELASWARASGLEVEQVTGMSYNPLAKRAALVSNTEVNYLMACRKPG